MITRVMYDREIGAVTVGHERDKKHFGEADEAVVEVPIDHDDTWIRSDDRFLVIKSGDPLDVHIDDGVLHVE